MEMPDFFKDIFKKEPEAKEVCRGCKKERYVNYKGYCPACAWIRKQMKGNL